MVNKRITFGHCTLQVYFPSVYTFDQPEVVAMFRTLEYSGLRKYLGGPFIFYEKEVREFFKSATMVGKSIVETVNGVEISFDETLYAEFFELPTEGHPFDLILSSEVMQEMKKTFSADGSMIHVNGNKKVLKPHFILLNNVVAKALQGKSGSFHLYSYDRFDFMCAISKGIQVNWASTLFQNLCFSICQANKESITCSIERDIMELLKVFFYFLLPLILLQLLVQVRRSRRFPPGPISLPIIGNLLSLGDKPHRSLTRLAQTYGPIMSLKLGQLTTIVISSPSMAQEVLQKQDISFSNRFIPDAIRACDEYKLSIIWLPTNDRWRSLRKLAHTHVFSGRVLDSNQHVRRRKVEELMTHVRKCSHEGVAVNIGKETFQTSLNVLSNILFSVDLANFESNEAQVFKDLVWNITLESGKPNLVDYFPALRAIDPQRIRKRMSLYFSKLLSLFGEIIDKKMEAMKACLSRDISEGDVIDMLIKISQDNPKDLDIQHIKHMCLDFFVAGTETTSNTLEWAMTELLRHPESMEKAKIELKRVVGVGKQVEESDISVLPFLQAVIKETLRIHPPVPYFVRQVCTEVDLRGYIVPKGANVLVNVWAIGRDRDHWENPMEFKPERFLDSKIDVRGHDFELIPFGSGRRVCVGLSLAMRILPTVLGSLINLFDWKIEGKVNPENLDIEEKFGFTLQRANPLLAVPIPI
ncbi:geraniol 8-hydroxylase-like [Impatiens glandulifera]|uniref:geraniol 8-hydroxylase-like n=1 Tax=Impatiens glandulifera TaxID=253017 RepID=UPI001FB07639|nr:geraniol 8-hydroxylase-like [Impatiens glandulifera]